MVRHRRNDMGTVYLEDLDLIVDPTDQTLKSAHGDEVLTLIM
jgi:hypothetical protein